MQTLLSNITGWIKNNKIKILVILFYILSIIILYLLFHRDLRTVENLTIEYGNQISLNVEDYLDKNLSIKTKEELIKNTSLEILNNAIEDGKEFQKVGNYIVRLTYKNNSEDVFVSIKDTISPVFKDFNEKISTYLEVIPKYEKIFKATDLSSVSISADDSKVNYNKKGKYTVVITAEDSSGNIVQKNATIEVKNPTIKFKNTIKEMTVGDNKKVSVTIKGKSEEVKYTSSDKKIATIDKKGKIVAKKAGTVTITAEANEVKTDFKLTIKEKPKTVVAYTNSSTTSSQPQTNKTTNSSGRTIALHKIAMNHPSNYNFGKYSKEAVGLYNAILNYENRYLVKFETVNDYNNFTYMFNNYVLAGTVAKLLPRTIYVYGERREVYFDNYLPDDFYLYTICEEMEAWKMAYNANVSAGLYTGMSETEAIRRINNWICSKMSYVINNQHADVTFRTGKGQCIAYAEMFQLMCTAANIQCQYISGVANGQGHAWNRVLVNGTWYYIDVTFNDSTGNAYYLSRGLWSDHSY